MSSDAVTALKITSDTKIELTRDNNVLCAYSDTGENVCILPYLLLLAFLYEIRFVWNKKFLFFNSLFQCILPNDELTLALGIVN
jgi:hypothetical protein